MPAKYDEPEPTPTPVTAQPLRSLKRDPTSALSSLKKSKLLASAKGVAAVAEAASEGVTLLTSSTNQSGFLNVKKDKAQWIARVTRDGKEVTIARCDTAEEAALAVALSMEARASEGVLATETRIAKARAMAEEEGLQLQRSDRCESGYAGVFVKKIDAVRYIPRVRNVDGVLKDVGPSVIVAEEAALALARYFDSAEGKAVTAFESNPHTRLHTHTVSRIAPPCVPAEASRREPAVEGWGLGRVHAHRTKE